MSRGVLAGIPNVEPERLPAAPASKEIAGDGWQRPLPMGRGEEGRMLQLGKIVGPTLRDSSKKGARNYSGFEKKSHQKKVELV